MHLGKMNSRVREDEKNEMIIRRLLKKTENKRCINCNSLGPQYVCTNFSIFVCTYCSGAHREFSHRIKSISMAKFTPAEVANLQTGGNGRAREFYFKELDLVRNPLPDSSDPIKLRNFINHVYVERRYTGERSAPTKGHEGAGDEYESRRLEVRKPDLRSPSREDQNNDRRNNGSARKSDVGSYYSEKRSPSGFEPDRPPRNSYDDREKRRDEKTNPEASRDRAKPPVRPFTSRNPEDDGPPIRSVKEILGNDVPTLRVDVIGNQLSGTTLASVGLPNHARSQSLNHLGNGEAAASDPAVKRVSSESMISLIDFTADPEPVVTSAPASDPFAPITATRPVVDTFAPTPAPASTNVSVLDIFGSDPFAVTAAAKPVADPFTPATTLKQTADPFGFENPSASAATSSWATFDFTGNPAPPEGYPGALSASTATNNMTAQFSGSDGWNNSANSGGNVWSAFGLQTAAVPASLKATAPVPVATSSSQQFNMFSTIEGQPTVAETAMQMSFPIKSNPVDKLQTSSASGRPRRELPQDFFAQPDVSDMDARQDLAFSMGVGQIRAPQFPQRVLQVAAQPSRSRNPFDDDDTPPAPFNMGSMQAALPQVGDPLSGAASQWGQPISQFQPSAAPANAFGYGIQSISNIHQQNGQPSGFVQNQGFNQGAMYGGSPFYSQTAGTNPFGYNSRHNSLYSNSRHR